MRIAGFILACALIASGTARAQNLSFGSINGTVTDASGGALPGVTVTASSPALQVGQLTAVIRVLRSSPGKQLPAGSLRSRVTSRARKRS